MIFWWIGDVLLLVVVLPVIVYLLLRLRRATGRLPYGVDRVSHATAEVARDLNAAPALLATQDQAIKAAGGLAQYTVVLDALLKDRGR